MIFNEIKCHVNISLGLVGACIPCIPPPVSAPGPVYLNWDLMAMYSMMERVHFSGTWRLDATLFCHMMLQNFRTKFAKCLSKQLYHLSVRRSVAHYRATHDENLSTVLFSLLLGSCKAVRHVLRVFSAAWVQYAQSFSKRNSRSMMA